MKSGKAEHPVAHRYFCTYFDQRHLIYALALHQSLLRWAGEDVTLFALCLDEATFDRLQELSLRGVRAVRLADLEQSCPSLAEARRTRSASEYYFTLTPVLPDYLLTVHPEIDLIAYVDADLFFFSSLDTVYRELGDASTLIVPYRRPMGPTYNVGLLLFRNDALGRECLTWWRDRCLEWCYQRYEDTKFADEGYLDDWPTRFRGVVVSAHRGVGLGPWNAGQHTLTGHEGAVQVDGVPLVFYHFGAVRMTRRFLVRHNLPYYRTHMTPALKRLVYAPYVKALQSAAKRAWVGGVAVGGRRGGYVKSTLIRELFFARLFAVGPFLIQVDYGSLGHTAVAIYKRTAGLFRAPD